MLRTIVPLVLAGAILGSGCSLFAPKPAPRRAAASPTACDEGDVKACHELGLVLSKKTGDPAARERALGYFRLACQRGHGPGCLELKRMEEKSCGGGVPQSCFALGEWYRLGNKAVKPDLAKARRYYEAACSEGLSRACYQLGLLWLAGRGGPASEDRAKHYLGEACKGKHAKACAKLGR